MKYFSVLFLSVLFVTMSTQAQEKFEKYTVSKGETIYQIAQKFKITPSDIYKLNPDAQNGLKPNSVLLIPKNNSKNPVVSTNKPKEQPKTHVVLAKETLYGIESKYGVTDEALKKANPFLEKEGLQIGQTLNIPPVNNVKSPVVDKNVVVYHTVLAKETKYSIAKQYNITIEELEKKNPEIITNLAVGTQLIIKGNASKPIIKDNTVDKKAELVKSITVPAPEVVYMDYQVKAKETFYSLSKMFELTPQQLMELNPALSGGVEEGMILKVPSKVNNEVASIVEKQKVVLSKMNNAERKTLVLLLPFNVAKSVNDTISVTSRIKNDKFLNMTLDFYSGAMMAIDSAKELGLNLDVKIFDSNETKNTSNVAAVFRQNNLQNADAVIGPFYQNNTETAANLLALNNVPVISPLSKDTGNPFNNLYQSIVSNSILKSAMFDYLNKKQGNVIAVIDKKRESIKNYFLENQKQIKIAPLTASASLDVANFKTLLVKDKMNYIILETGNTAMIKQIINTLLAAMTTYQVQLVILEANETLDTDEIILENLTKLHLLYPSATRENNSPEAKIFAQNYKKINKVNPSTYAIRGFDVTFDTMMRLSQGKTYQETTQTMITEQIESKFDYSLKSEGGYENKGAYILYYDTDLTIKEAQ